jgi:hypothetical protein
VHQKEKLFLAFRGSTSELANVHGYYGITVSPSWKQGKRGENPSLAAEESQECRRGREKRKRPGPLITSPPRGASIDQNERW